LARYWSRSPPGPLVGRAQQLDQGDQLPVAAIANFQKRQPFDIHGRQIAFRGGVQHGGSGLVPGVGTRDSPSDRNICPSQESPLLGREFMDENMFVDLHDVARIDLNTNQVAYARHEAFVEIVPGVFLLQVRIHAGKWRGHDSVSFFPHCTRSPRRGQGRKCR